MLFIPRIIFPLGVTPSSFWKLIPACTQDLLQEGYRDPQGCWEWSPTAPLYWPFGLQDCPVCAAHCPAGPCGSEGPVPLSQAVSAEGTRGELESQAPHAAGDPGEGQGWPGWGFPGTRDHIRVSGCHELVFQAFKSSPEIQERLVRAYELMLGFYGIRLEDRSSGRVGRAHNYAERFQNLNR